nr:MAG TPA: hypothetical protein [Caudoviricetes sp.]
MYNRSSCSFDVDTPNIFSNFIYAFLYALKHV